jgi:hypothetical protein
MVINHCQSEQNYGTLFVKGESNEKDKKHFVGGHGSDCGRWFACVGEVSFRYAAGGTVCRGDEG